MKYQISDDEWAELAGSPTPQTSGLSLWLSMNGRISRKTYWLKFLVPIFLIQFLGAFADGIAGYTDPDVAGPVSSLALLLILWPAMMGVVKRLHDHDKSGWVWVVVFPGGIALFLFEGLIGQEAFGMLVVIWGFVMVVLGIWLGFVRGTVGPNRYGPDPLGTRDRD